MENIRSIYFIGIGGIGMSALARYFNSKGIKVAGYDRVETELTKSLEQEGIDVHYTEDVNSILEDADIVVYTPAVPAGHAELVYYREKGTPVLKRSQVLGILTQDTFNICVAGTHGKTTTSTMIAHILRHSGFGCNAFLGGIAVNYDSNYWSHERKVCVVEADEYDRSFLQLYADLAVITAMDPDHLDIYGTAAVMEDAFVQFAHQLKSGGHLYVKEGLARMNDFSDLNHSTYSYHNTRSGSYASNIRSEWGGYHFDVHYPSGHIDALYLPMGGWHNIENAVAAVSVAVKAGVSEEGIRNALAEFRGVKRRFEYIIRESDQVFIDDYAHHPEELRALISSAKQLFPGLHCTVIFQPHLFTRTRDLAVGFAESLDLADEVLLLPIYPARELPIEGVSSEMIREKMSHAPCSIIEKTDLLGAIEKRPIQLLITAGAGDIDQWVEPIKKILKNH